MLRKIIKIPGLFIIGLIKVYQKTLSRDHSWLSHLFPYGYCRFYPTCSEYTKQAIQKYGFIKGIFLGIKRILHCHPFNKGGNDPLL